MIENEVKIEKVVNSLIVLIFLWFCIINYLNFDNEALNKCDNLDLKEVKVFGDSMSPLIKSGDYVYYDDNFTEEDIKLNTVIIFKSDCKMIGHRVIALLSDFQGKFYLTKGDNNQFLDFKRVRFDDVYGIIECGGLE